LPAGSGGKRGCLFGGEGRIRLTPNRLPFLGPWGQPEIRSAFGRGGKDRRPGRKDKRSIPPIKGQEMPRRADLNYLVGGGGEGGTCLQKKEEKGLRWGLRPSLDGGQPSRTGSRGKDLCWSRRTKKRDGFVIRSRGSAQKRGNPIKRTDIVDGEKGKAVYTLQRERPRRHDS